MAQQQIRYLEYPEANVKKSVFYDPVPTDATLRITVVTARLDASQPIGEGDTELASDGLPAGSVLVAQYCSLQTPTTGITVVALDQSPYAQEVADPAAAQCAAPTGPCTVDVSAQIVNGYVKLTVSGAQGQWESSVNQVNWSPLSDTYPEPSVTTTYYVRDASNCRAQVTIEVVPPPGENPVPLGSIIDSFGSPLIQLYYYQGSITPYSPSFQVLPEQVSQPERGRETGEQVTAMCEGTTRVQILSDLFFPFATITETPNSPECGAPAFELVSQQGEAPAFMGGLGSWRVKVSGGTAPRQFTVQGLTGTTLFASDGTARREGLAPGAYTAILTDSSTPPQTIVVDFTVPAFASTPEPVTTPTLPEPPAQNLETFPFSAEGSPLPDAQPAACVDAPFAVTSPQGKFLPFCLRRLRQADRWLDCARVLDADTLEVLQEFDPRTLAYEKFQDGTYDYFLYYGALVADLNLPTCQRLRLQVDEFTSVAFQVTTEPDEYLLARWWHPAPLYHLPYGTGLEQHLYVRGATLREQAPREERTETKNASTGAVRVDFLAQSRTVSFDIEPLPGWLVQAVQGAKLHRLFAAADFQQGHHPVREVQQREVGPDLCARLLTLTLEYPPVVVVGCPAFTPTLQPLPAAYARTC